jgi:hypothetical protein
MEDQLIVSYILGDDDPGDLNVETYDTTKFDGSFTDVTSNTATYFHFKTCLIAPVEWSYQLCYSWKGILILKFMDQVPLHSWACTSLSVDHPTLKAIPLRFVLQ